MRIRPVTFSALFILLSGGVTGPALSADTAIFIGEFRVEDARSTSDRATPLTYDLIHEKPDVIREALSERIPTLVRRDDSVSFQIREYPSTRTPPDPTAHMSASFLIDYTEPIFETLKDGVKQRYGPHPTPRQLEEFVFYYIESKNYAHLFDLASTVARSRAGDCTEHAVLLTALLRMFGYPARMVIGTYVHLEEKPKGFGHAWTEYYGESRWRGLDGTRIAGAVDQHYVPLSVIEDESISYGIGLMSAMQAAFVQRIVIR